MSAFFATWVFVRCGRIQGIRSYAVRRWDASDTRQAKRQIVEVDACRQTENIQFDPLLAGEPDTEQTDRSDQEQGHE